jgi:hypothetical protein
MVLIEAGRTWQRLAEAGRSWPKQVKALRSSEELEETGRS